MVEILHLVSLLPYNNSHIMFFNKKVHKVLFQANKKMAKYFISGGLYTFLLIGTLLYIVRPCVGLKFEHWLVAHLP